MSSTTVSTKKKKSKKKIIRLIIIVLAVLVVIGAACYTLFIAPKLTNEEVVYKENTAQYGILTNVVTESGTVAFGITSEKYDLDISTDDDDDDDDDDDEEEEEKYLKVEEVYVAVGQRINEGDAIYKFTQDSIEDVRKALTYSKTEAEIELAQANTEYQQGITTAKLSKDETLLAAALATENYQISIAKYYNDMATNTLKIEQALIEINSIQRSLVEESYTNNKESVVSTYENALDALEEASEEYFTVKVSANTTFRKAKESYDKFFEEYDEKNESIQKKIKEISELEESILKTQKLVEKDLLKLEQTLETSTVSGEVADNKYASQIEQYENKVNSATQKLEEATKKLDDFNSFVGDGIVYSTGTGLITEMGYEVDDYLIMAGTMFSYATNDDMTISVDVSQEDVVTMTVGDVVDIKFTAYENETYEGRIQSITTTATSRSKATISYPVVISIKGDTSKLYQGMTADVSFITEETPEIVYVSRKAIVEENSRKYIYVKEKGEYVLKPVTTGEYFGENVEIIDGINQGDTYYVRTVIFNTSKDEDNSKKEENTSTDTDSNTFSMPDGFDFNSDSMPSGGFEFNGGGMPSGFGGPQ